MQEFSPRDLGIFQSSSRGLVLEALEGGTVKVFCRRTSSVREHFVHFAEITKEEIDGRSSPWRIHEVPESSILQRSEKVMEAFIECKSREKSGRWITRGIGSRGFAS
jgi:hypothetical protein